MSYKSILLKLVPASGRGLARNVHFALRLLPNLLYDARRYLRYSGMNRSHQHKSEHATRVILFYHQVEKGLSLAQPRPGFGAPVISRLLADTRAYVGRYGWEYPATTAVHALRAYVRFNRSRGQVEVADKVQAALDETLRVYPDVGDALSADGGGVREVSREQLAQEREASFAGFFGSRHSIRNFSGEVVPESEITAAVACAQKTPSVCNRQTWRVHAFSDKALIQQLMAIQAGGRGFAEGIDKLLVVTCDLGYFVEVAERYQAWIDGGMFSMSLCLALHDRGFGTCCLNWSKEAADDRRLRAAASLPGSDQVIMLIAVGGLPPTLNVAYSNRPAIERCLVWH